MVEKNYSRVVNHGSAFKLRPPLILTSVDPGDVEVVEVTLQLGEAGQPDVLAELVGVVHRQLRGLRHPAVQGARWQREEAHLASCSCRGIK